MKQLLEKNKQWEYAFGDVGEVTEDAHEDDEFPEIKAETASNQQCMLTTACRDTILPCIWKRCLSTDCTRLQCSC